jgi:hypothetical protein
MGKDIHMRVLIAAAVAATMFTTNLLAAESETLAPLAPGKAAGLQKAQSEDNDIWWWALGGAAVAGIVILATNSGGSSSPAGGTTTTSTATSTST